MALAVGLGAIGAHALRGSLSPADMEIYRTGTLYHLVHGAAAVWASTQPRLSRMLILLLLGCVFFSGSLYLLVTTQTRWLGAVTPIGGVLWIIAWLLFAFQKPETTNA